MKLNLVNSTKEMRRNFLWSSIRKLFLSQAKRAVKVFVLRRRNQDQICFRAWRGCFAQQNRFRCSRTQRTQNATRLTTENTDTFCCTCIRTYIMLASRNRKINSTINATRDNNSRHASQMNKINSPKIAFKTPRVDHEINERQIFVSCVTF